MQRIQTVEMNNRDFIMFGCHEFGYIKELDGYEVQSIIGDTGIPSDVEVLFALYTADGSRMVVAETYEEVRASAWKYGLETMTLH